MRPRRGFELPPDMEPLARRTIRIEWWTLFFLSTIVVVMYATMGNSQAMKAAWLEDVLSMIPPVAILLAARYRDRRPTAHFPYGYHRAVSIAFLVAALALLTMGSYMLYDSIGKLVAMEHPSIGLIPFFGREIWLGWLMIAALSYSAIAPVILGRMKIPLAHQLHDKALYADADMNKADWLTAVAGIFGILGIGIGWWWADGVAAGIISLDVVRDGFKNTRRVIADLMDSRPTTVETAEPDEVVERLETWFLGFDWVVDARARLREEGHVFTGEVFVIPRPGTDDLVEKMADAVRKAPAVDWRLWEIVVMPVTGFEPE
ncbi:MAG: cation diffusion facilitator family transporter [Thermoanaerobaculia bacterium]